MESVSGFYAHTPGRGSVWHDLVLHLEQTAIRARDNGAKFGAGEIGYFAGLWHDLGKFNPEFQEYLVRCASADRNGHPPPAKSVPHAIYGSKFAREAYPPLMQVIYGHHAGLPEIETAKHRISAPDLAEPFAEIMRLANEHLEGFGQPFDSAVLLTDPPRNEREYELFLRMVFSTLVDADFLDTEAHFDPQKAGSRGARPHPSDLWPLLEASQGDLLAAASDTSVNRVRTEVYEACLCAASEPQGVFRLCVPTGGGKTRSGLAFALKHAVEHGLDRVIVAAPYTSIIEQTVDEYRSIFESLGEDVVLEHHSAVARESGDGSEEAYQARVRTRLATQNWDAPLVVTTTVQLFESLFARRTSHCRKLHNIAHSIIVLDEVQTLPLRLLTPILDVLNELARRYSVTVVLCTATQPALDERTRYLEGFDPAAVSDIVPRDQTSVHFRELRRVEYEIPDDRWSWDDVARRLMDFARKGRALVVLNSRRDALAVLDAIGDGQPGLFHLSTLLCGAHRRVVLDEVRRRLRTGAPCLLVSTQVVEAGVDLDFPVVFRALGPLDRIVQAAGRCNREGSMDSPGRVVVFRPIAGRVPPGEYASAVAEAELILRRDDLDLHDPDIFREYFSRMYRVVSTDEFEIQSLRESLDYPEVADRFRLIPDDTVPVIVPYEERDPRKETTRLRLLERIRSEGFLRPGDQQRLQPYTVGLRGQELERVAWMTEEIAEGMRLWTGEYDPLRGLSAMRFDPADLV